MIHPARLLSAWREWLSSRSGIEAPQNPSLQAKRKAKAKEQASEDPLVQPAEFEQDALLALLASEAPEPVGNLLGVYAQAPLTTTSDSDDDRAGLLTSPNTSPLAGPNAVTSSQVTGSAALAPVLISPALGLFGASAALVSWDSNSQTAPPSDSTAPIFISKASVSENTPTSTVVHSVLASDNRGVTTYAFEAGGADNAKFSLNTSTGALTFLSSPDF